LWEVAAVLPRWGVTAWLPTIVTAPAGARRRALEAWRAGAPPAPAGGAPAGAAAGAALRGPVPGARAPRRPPAEVRGGPRSRPRRVRGLGGRGGAGDPGAGAAGRRRPDPGPRGPG